MSYIIYNIYLCTLFIEDLILNITNMKKIKFASILMAATLMITSCGMSNTAKGGLIGGGSGAALGAIVGKIIGGNKGAFIGGAAGTALGATAGVIIGKKMDKAATAAKQISGAKVDTMTLDGVKAVKVTLDGGVTFATGKSIINSNSQSTLAAFARKLDQDVDLAVYGHTDNTGSLAINQTLSLNRANAVADYLENNGIAGSRIKDIKGYDYQYPVASNSTEAGRAQNRRVELYLLASSKMIQEATNASK